MSVARHDPLARRIAAAALAFALVAVVLAGYAVMVSQQYLEDVRLLGETMERQTRAPSLVSPPPQLETD